MTAINLTFCIVISLFWIAFFAGYEIAFISANRLTIELKKKQGLQSGLILSRFMDTPTKFIGTCLIGFNIFLVLYSLFFEELMEIAVWQPIDTENKYLKLIVNTLLSAILVLVVGEFIPKAIFRSKNNKLLHLFAQVAQFFYYVLQPITHFFVSVAQKIARYVFGLPITDQNHAFTKVDLEYFFQQTKVYDEDSMELNTDLFENALSLPTVKLRQCLVPRTEVEAIEINDTIGNAKQQFIDTHLSKLIVYEENIDNIKGYIHQLDLFKKPHTIKSILLPIPIVPESMSATDLLNKFTKLRKSIAWVVDEFGGTAGIITMEDVLEEIFGEIRDEYDTEEVINKQLTATEFIFSGRLELDFLNEKYNLHFPDHASETLSGYIIQQFERIPKRKETITLAQYQFYVLSVSDTRIETVKMKILS